MWKVKVTTVLIILSILGTVTKLSKAKLTELGNRRSELIILESALLNRQEEISQVNKEDFREMT